MRVLFVCSGNICRSPMAAEYFRQQAARAGLSHVVVASAGTLGIEGAPASVEARQAMQEIGVDLDQHRSQGVDEAVLKPTDVVIVMTRRHLAELDEAFPGMPQERWLLRAFEQGPEPVPKAKDLPDPIGKPIEAYRKLLQVITPAMDHLALFLRYRS